MPRIDLKFMALDGSDVMIAKVHYGCDVQAVVKRAIGLDVRHPEPEEPDGWMQSATVHAMLRGQKLFFQMHEGTGDLDESTKKSLVISGILQPEVFEHIVRLVIIPPVETGEISEVARMQIRNDLTLGVQFPDKRLHAVELFHLRTKEVADPFRARRSRPTAESGRLSRTNGISCSRNGAGRERGALNIGRTIAHFARIGLWKCEGEHWQT